MIVGLADVVQVLQQGADAVVELRHTGSIQAVVRFAVHHGPILRGQERPDVHARRVVPDEEGLAILLGLVHEGGSSMTASAARALRVSFCGGFMWWSPFLWPWSMACNARPCMR
jgi:hypothetical protein